MAAGRVCTGYSKPYVAVYSESSGTVTYTGGMRLGRGVSVSLDIDAADDNTFYADNVAAESASGVFGGGSGTFTIDGLKRDAERLIYGIPAADSDGMIHYGDSMTIPYVGIGYIKRYMEDGVTTYVPVILRKAKFQTAGDDAATQEEEINWQTQELTAQLFRDDTTNHDWRLIGDEETTEAAAEAIIRTQLGITA